MSCGVEHIRNECGCSELICASTLSVVTRRWRAVCLDDWDYPETTNLGQEELEVKAEDRRLCDVRSILFSSWIWTSWCRFCLLKQCNS